jgi:hypothetical protein
MKRFFGNKNTENSGVSCAFPCIFKHVLFYLSFQDHKPDSLLGENLETAQTEKQVHNYFIVASNVGAPDVAALSGYDRGAH